MAQAGNPRLFPLDSSIYGSDMTSEPSAGQRPVRAEIPAPEVLNDERRHHQHTDHQQAGDAQEAEKVEHLDGRDQPIGRVHEALDGPG